MGTNNETGRCQKSAKEAFELIRSELHKRYGFRVTTKLKTLTITIDGASIQFMEEDLPCFLEDVPRLLILYIIAQLTTVALEEVGSRAPALQLADADIKAKILVLHDVERMSCMHARARASQGT